MAATLAKLPLIYRGPQSLCLRLCPYVRISPKHSIAGVTIALWSADFAEGRDRFLDLGFLDNGKR